MWAHSKDYQLKETDLVQCSWALDWEQPLESLMRVHLRVGQLTETELESLSWALH